MSTILIFFSASLLGALLFLFIYWRKMNEDYTSEMIFGSGFSILFFVILCTFVSLFSAKYVPQSIYFDRGQIWFWAAVLGYLVAFLLNFLKNKIKFFESLEASGMGLFAWLGFIYLANGIADSRIESMLAAITVAVLFVFYFFLEKRYRKFTWYKSGRVGFSGLMTLGTFFLIRSIFSIYGGTVLSLAGRIEIVLSSVAAFLLYFSVYHLSEA